METFESKIILAEKSLNNIRGYLWKRKNIFKTWLNKSSDIKRGFLER